MATNWITPTSDDVQTLLNSVVAGAANEEDSGGTSRLDKLVPIVVNEVRGAILSAGRVPLSITPGSVPPEAVKPTLVLVVEALVYSTPQMQQFAQSDWLGWTIKAARDWIQSIREGQAVTTPTDPDPTFVIGPDWGDFSGMEISGVAGRVDLTTDGPIVSP